MNMLPLRPDVAEVTGHRQPTQSEIKFSHGATHYKTFPAFLWKKKDGTKKKFIVCQHDGLRYYA